MRIDDAIKSTFTSDRLRAIVNLQYTANWMRDFERTIFEPHGLLPQHFNVLRIVKGRNPEPITPGEIREVMLDKGRDLTRLVDKLERCGYVRRRTCPTNRRSVEIFLTTDGEALTDQVSSELEKAFQGKLSMTDKDFRRLSDLLDIFRGDDK